MTLPNPGAWQAKLEQADPGFYAEVMSVRNHVLTEGALPLKVKVLMTMLCDAICAHPDGVRNIANRARAVGATEAEILETIGVAFVMGGTAALTTACNALPE
jgi:alkylhydroperoxidase/carboxymuconolactone decarboxylase family protein YurZ